jgi:hypothetical protein
LGKQGFPIFSRQGRIQRTFSVFASHELDKIKNLCAGITRQIIDPFLDSSLVQNPDPLPSLPQDLFWHMLSRLSSYQSL